MSPPIPQQTTYPQSAQKMVRTHSRNAPNPPPAPPSHQPHPQAPLMARGGSNASRRSQNHHPPTHPPATPKEPDPKFIIYLRLPFNRNGFVDPPQVDWDSTKERQLWRVLSKSRTNGETGIDWDELAANFGVTRAFLLQQAAWLYERELQQVRMQMRRGLGMGGSINGFGGTSRPMSPVVGTGAFGGVKMVRGTSGSGVHGDPTLRVHSAQNIRSAQPPTPRPGHAVPASPIRPASQPMSRTPSSATARPSSQTAIHQAQAQPHPHRFSNPISISDQEYRSSPINHNTGLGLNLGISPEPGTLQSRPYTILDPYSEASSTSHSEDENDDSENETSENEETAAASKRAKNRRKKKRMGINSDNDGDESGDNEQDEFDDERERDDELAFLPFAAHHNVHALTGGNALGDSGSMDDEPADGIDAHMAATLTLQRNRDRDRSGTITGKGKERELRDRNVTPIPAMGMGMGGVGVGVAGGGPYLPPGQTLAEPLVRHGRSSSHGHSRPSTATPANSLRKAIQMLPASTPGSPVSRAVGAGKVGGGAGNNSSSASPSMGSSFSDLSDASVSQSALEDAYLSTMQSGGVGGGAGSGGAGGGGRGMMSFSNVGNLGRGMGSLSLGKVSRRFLGGM